MQPPSFDKQQHKVEADYQGKSIWWHKEGKTSGQAAARGRWGKFAWAR